MDEHPADELFRRALIDADASAAVALRVSGLPLCEALTVVFHGRRDLGTIQTYVAHGGRGAGAAVAADELMRVPCDLDLAAAEDREEAEHLYAEQAWRCATRSRRPTPCSTSGASRSRTSPTRASRSTAGSGSTSGCRRHRLLPAALVAPDKGIVVTAVCGARPLAEGKPPMGIACAQQDVARVYPLPDDPERCLEDFFEHAAEHARRVGEQLGRQEQSVRRFLELSGEGFDGHRLDLRAAMRRRRPAS